MDIDEIRERARPVLQEHGVKEAAVFGSYARGEADQDSDIDILVTLEDDTSLLDVARLKNDLEDALGTDVDIVEDGALKPSIRDTVQDQLVALI